MTRARPRGQTRLEVPVNSGGRCLAPQTFPNRGRIWPRRPREDQRLVGHLLPRQSIRYTAYKRRHARCNASAVSLPNLPEEANMATVSKSERVPKPMHATFNAIVALTDAFCRAHLNEEYAQLAR